MQRPHLAIATWAGLVLVLPWLAFAHAPDDERLDVLSRRIQEEPGDAELYWARAEIHRGQGRWEPALHDYARVQVLDPERFEIHEARARLYLAMSRFDRARQEVERYRALRPLDPSGLRTRARILKAQGHDQESALDLERALAMDSRPRPAEFLECAQALAQLGDPGREQALRVLDDGIARLGEPVSLLWQAWKLEAETGRLEAALGRLVRLEQVLPRPALALAYRGDLLCEAGRRLEAEACWTEALEDLERIPAARRTVALQDLTRRVREKLANHALEDRSP